MNGINRIGQKVRCIDRFIDWCPNIKQIPILNGVYTVRGFEDCINVPGIHLNEITNTRCSCHERDLSWPLAAFRPLIDDQVKNEHVIKIIDRANKKTKEKEKV